MILVVMFGMGYHCFRNQQTLLVIFEAVRLYSLHYFILLLLNNLLVFEQ